MWLIVFHWLTLSIASSQRMSFSTKLIAQMGKVNEYNFVKRFSEVKVKCIRSYSSVSLMCE